MLAQNSGDNLTAYNEGVAARKARYAKGSNPYRGTPGGQCKSWNIGWTDQKKKEKNDASEA